MSEHESIIYNETRLCQGAFADLQACGAGEPTQPDLPTSSWIHDENGRFNIWASNIGAFQHVTHHSSLDYRLRDSTRMREQVSRVLKYLESSLRELTAITSGQRPQKTLTSALEREDDFELVQLAEALDSPDEADEPTTPNTSPQTEAQTLAQAVTSAITSLYKLSILLRNPTGRDRYAKAANYPAFNPTFDVDHVWQVFPKLRSHPLLCDRLGKANTRRRQLLRYRQMHRERLSAPRSRAEVVAPSLQQHDPQVPDPSLAGSSLNPATMTVGPTTATTFVSHDFQVVERPEEVQSTIATTETGSGEVRIPQPPPGALTGVPFECPYCFTIQTVANMQAWKKHLFGDLQPYVCTCEGTCNQTLYTERPVWFDHELQTHRKQWVCRYCTHDPFSTAGDLIHHLSDSHKAAVSAEHLQSVAEISTQPIQTFSRSSCPFCDEWQHLSQTRNVPASMFRNHVAHHLEQLALFVLPSTTNFITTDDDSDDGHDSDADTVSVGLQTVTGEGPMDTASEDYPVGTALRIFESDEVVPLESVRQLGIGAAGIIDEARQTKTGVLYARKLLKQEHREFAQRGFDLEQEMLNILGLHPHTMQLAGVYQWREEMGMLRLPVANTNLANILSTQSATVGLPGQEMSRRAFLIRSIGCLVSGMEWIHQQGISHNDLKPRNVLISSTRPFWAGFGLASQLDPSGQVPPGPAIMPKYAAPEVAIVEHRGQKADVFSLSCIILEMIAATLGLTEEEFARIWNRDGSGNFESNVEWTIDHWLASIGRENSHLINAAITTACQRGLRLHSSLRPSSSELLRLLCEARSDDQTAALFCPDCIDGNLERTRAVIEERSAFVSQRAASQQDVSPLRAAVLGSDHAEVLRLLPTGVDVDEDDGNCTILQGAIVLGNYAIVESLIQAGADVNAEGAQQIAPIQVAIRNNEFDIARLLLRNGASLHIQSSDDGTALTAAAAKVANIELIRLLLDEGADVNAEGGVYGYPLIAAASRGSTATCRLLLERGAYINVQSATTTALSAAAGRGFVDLVQLLLDNGADVNGVHPGYANALQTASATGHLAVVKLLVEAGANVTAKGGTYGDALNAAKVVGHTAVIDFLQPYFESVPA